MSLIPLVLELMKTHPDAFRVAPPGGSGVRRRAYVAGGRLSNAPESVQQRRTIIRTVRQAGASQRGTAELLGISEAMVARAGR